MILVLGVVLMLQNVKGKANPPFWGLPSYNTPNYEFNLFLSILIQCIILNVINVLKQFHVIKF